MLDLNVSSVAFSQSCSGSCFLSLLFSFALYLSSFCSLQLSSHHFSLYHFNALHLISLYSRFAFQFTSVKFASLQSFNHYFTSVYSTSGSIHSSPAMWLEHQGRAQQGWCLVVPCRRSIRPSLCLSTSVALERGGALSFHGCVLFCRQKCLSFNGALSFPVRVLFGQRCGLNTNVELKRGGA